MALTEVKTLTTPNEHVVEMAENILEMAKSGELRSLVMAATYSGFRSGGNFVITEEADRMALLGEFEFTKKRLINFIEADAEVG